MALPKQLGMTRDVLHPDLVCDKSTFANKINQALARVTEEYSPLPDPRGL